MIEKANCHEIDQNLEIPAKIKKIIEVCKNL